MKVIFAICKITPPQIVKHCNSKTSAQFITIKTPGVLCKGSSFEEMYGKLSDEKKRVTAKN